MKVVQSFLEGYLQDNHQRTVLFGINPGRFGSGVTGISFTDPVRLKEVLGIDHSFDMRPELSSQFIYEVIESYGGPQKFYQSFFISAVYPLGFLKDGKNINYYELENWRDYMEEPIVKELEQHMDWNVNRDVCVCIGKGRNYKELKRLNETHQWFNRIEVLPHPRWILQYRLREKEMHLNHYLQTLDDLS